MSHHPLVPVYANEPSRFHTDPKRIKLVEVIPGVSVETAPLIPGPLNDLLSLSLHPDLPQDSHDRLIDEVGIKAFHFELISDPTTVHTINFDPPARIVQQQINIALKDLFPALKDSVQSIKGTLYRLPGTVMFESLKFERADGAWRFSGYELVATRGT